MNERILPAYPLFVKDPNFSLWSMTEELNRSSVQSWWGAEKKIYGFIRTDGKTYCFLGNAQDFQNCGVIPAEQTELSVTAFSTDYVFSAGKTCLKLRFVSPLPPDDPELISLPVCYMEYEIQGDSGAELSLFVNRRIAYNDLPANADKRVRSGVIRLRGFESAYIGLRRQLPLSADGDAMGADWGYFYLSGEKAFSLDETDLAAYLAGGYTGFSGTGEERYIGSVNHSLSGAVMLGYDDVVSIDYFGRFLKGYYLETHTITEALEYTFDHRDEIDRKLLAFDLDLQRRAEPFGDDYLTVLYASLRQSVGAHKLARDERGNLLFLSKECYSDGCIATVDVSYPSMPLYLLYNPELVKGMMRPILRFARMPVWTYDFAPHDAGMYPACCGQIYGLNRNPSLSKEDPEETYFPIYLLPAGADVYDYARQMPVEECANLLIMFLACLRADGDLNFYRENADLAAKWVRYLVRYGLKPENQLCTDDFAGHLKNNVNLAIKAAVGIAAYAELTAAAGNPGEGAEYRAAAEQFAAQITAFSDRYGHLPLTWDCDDATYSLKYNLAFDKALRLKLFPQEVLEREADICLLKSNRYGTPLDSRRDYTKSDWLVWTASLSDDPDKKKAMISRIRLFLKESPDRVPFGDWYGTKAGNAIEFRARSVQGGCFMLMM